MSTLLILKATAGGLQGEEVPLIAPAHCVLGRSRSCALRLAGDETVSRQHCLIEIDGEGAWARDLGSLNGTLVNGEKIGQRELDSHGCAIPVQPPRRSLHDGDELRIGNNVFRIELPESVPGQENPTVRRASSNSGHALCG